MTILKTTTVWTGFTGSPGYTNFYFAGAADADDATAAVNKTMAFWVAVAQALPSALTLRCNPDVEVIDETTGKMQDVVTVGTNHVQAGGLAGSFAGGAGACFAWQTAGIVDGRRVRGRTFLVPLSGSMYQTDGTLTDIALTRLGDGGTVMANPTGAQLVVWSRPRPDEGIAGSAHDVLSFRVRDKVAVLRSRRD